MKKLMSVFMIAAICFNIVSLPAIAIDNTIDQYLLSLGVPASVLATMTDGQKEMIASTIEPDARFVSYEEENYAVSEDDNTLQPLNTISPSDLTLSISAFAITVNGEQLYAIYPSYVWHCSTTVNNDAFGYALCPGWEVIAGEENFRIHMFNTSGDTAQTADYDPVEASYCGYIYQMSSWTLAQLRYEGHAYCRAKDTTGNSTHMASLKYADCEMNYGVNFGFSIGPGFVGISSTSDNVRYMANNFTFMEY